MTLYHDHQCHITQLINLHLAGPSGCPRLYEEYSPSISYQNYDDKKGIGEGETTVSTDTLTIQILY